MLIKYTVIKNIDDLCMLESSWKNLEKGSDMTVFQSFSWNKLLCEQWLTFRYNRIFTNICIFQVIDNEETILIAPLIIQKHSFGIKWLGRKKGIYFLGKDSYSDYMNFVYTDFKDSVANQLVNELHSLYPRLNVYLDYVRDDTDTTKWCEKKHLQDSHTTSAYIDINCTKTDYEKSLSKSTKQNLRTALNRMNRDGYDYQVTTYHNIDDKNFIDKLDKIHAVRTKSKNSHRNINWIKFYSRYLNAEFTEHKNRKYNIVSNSMRRLENSVLVVVTLNDDIAGYLYGLQDERAIRIMQNCFKGEFSFYSPLFRGAYDYILTQIEQPDKPAQIDFTRGDEQYKIKLGGREMLLHHFVIRN